MRDITFFSMVETRALVRSPLASPVAFSSTPSLLVLLLPAETLLPPAATAPLPDDFCRCFAEE